VSPQVAQNQLKYRTAPSHEPSEQQMDNNLNIARIENGQDMRTTVMIKNIPNKMTDKDLMTFIERVCARRIDFFYLRMDFKNGMHVILAATCLTENQAVMLGMRSLISLQSTISFALRRHDSASGGESLGFYQGISLSCAQEYVCQRESPSNVLCELPVRSLSFPSLVMRELTCILGERKHS